MKYYKNNCKHVFIIFVMGKIYEDNFDQNGPLVLPIAALPTVMFVPFFLYNFHPYRSSQSFEKLTSISRIMQHLDFNGGKAN